MAKTYTRAQLEAHVNQLADEIGIDRGVAKRWVSQESGWDHNATSPMGAKGLLQLMPDTARALGVKDPSDPIQNLDGGFKYLKQQIQRFGRLDLAFAAYNAGPAAVAKYGGVPPYAETQNYVKNIVGGPRGSAAVPAGRGTSSTAPASGQGALPDISALLGPNAQAGSNPAAQLMQFAAPSASTVSALQRLGGTAGEVAQRAQEPIPTPDQAVTAGASPSSGGGQQQSGPTIIPHSGGLNGDLPMALGGTNPYSNIQFAGHVDWQHVNPRLLDSINREAKKRNAVATVISGYRSNDYSVANGGFKGDPHTKGLAVDAYINGHPIGDVISPDEWSKYGVRSGNTPGFYKGKPDPEHLDLIGLPVKGG